MEPQRILNSQNILEKEEQHQRPQTFISKYITEIKTVSTIVGEDVEERKPRARLIGMQAGAAAVENSMEVSQKNEKCNCLMTQQFHFWVDILRNPKH